MIAKNPKTSDTIWKSSGGANVNFFDYIKNESFFKTFTLKYRRIYYDCIQLLIDKLKELPVLYESDARDSITIYLRKEVKNMVRT